MPLQTVQNRVFHSELEDLAGALPLESPNHQKVAILLNSNAKQVNKRRLRELQRLAGKEHVYLSTSLQEAEGLCRELVQKGYGTIASGGGDGTLCKTANLIQHYIEEANRWRAERFKRFGEKQTLLSMPRFAFLKLGTGNGISPLVGARSAHHDLKQIVQYGPLKEFELPMIEFRGERFYFGGLGFEAMVLHDYHKQNQRWKNKPLFKHLFSGLSGYFIAGLFKTAPRALLQPRPLQARIITRTKAYYVDPRRGDMLSEIPPGALLFEGSASIISAGTCPYFGKGIKMFPFAGLHPNKMQLRVGTLSPLNIIQNIIPLWRGTYRNANKCFDFIVDDIHIELERPSAFQHSGDAIGKFKDLDLRVAEHPLKLVDFVTPKFNLN